MKKTDTVRSTDYQATVQSTRHQTVSRTEQQSQAHEESQEGLHIHNSDWSLSREVEDEIKALDRKEFEFIGYRSFRQLHYPNLTPLMLIDNPSLRSMVRQNKQHEVRMIREFAHKPRFWTTAECVPTEYCWLYTKQENLESGKIQIIAKTDVRKT